MALIIHSVFYYGHMIDETNNKFDFKEGAGPEITATIPVGSYTLTKFLEVVAEALNDASSFDWSLAVDRDTRIVTITVSSASTILGATGSNVGTSCLSLLGVTLTDSTGTSFVGSSASGSEYKPQYPLQYYKPKTQGKELNNAVVTKSASGDTVSVQYFGENRFMKCNIQWITNNPSSGLLRNNKEAVAEAEAFLEYCVTKSPIEFMEDEDDRATFDRLYLESTAAESNGTEYELTEYYDKQLPGYFETGMLKFKVINVE